VRVTLTDQGNSPLAKLDLQDWNYTHTLTHMFEYTTV
jgi:hypothetical protein